jgi:hypothetical protein
MDSLKKELIALGLRECGGVNPVFFLTTNASELDELFGVRVLKIPIHSINCSAFYSSKNDSYFDIVPVYRNENVELTQKFIDIVTERIIGNENN